LHAIVVIAWKDLKQRLRDRSALVAAFVAPLAIAFIVSSAFGGGFVDSFGATYSVVDADQSQLSRAFAAQVLGAPQIKEQITVRRAKTSDEARRQVARDEVAAAFIIPKGFASAVTGNRRASITVLRNPDATIGSDVAEALAEAYTTQINATRLSVSTTLRSQSQPPDPAKIAELARAAAADRIPVQLVDGAIGVRKVNGVNYFGPAMAVFSLFFTTSFVARSIIAERQDGTLPRILAAPVPRPVVILGKSASAFVLGLVSFAVMFTVFGLVLDVSWGDPLALVVLTVTTVLAVMGLMTLLQTGAKTQESADAVSSMSTMTLALLGGSFFPIFQMPALMQKLSYLTPNGWAIRGYTDIAYDGATLGDLGPHLLAIGAFAVVTLSLGMWRSRSLA
jgi:linearmycin/streptolysin S transport system permease protein